MNQRIWGFLGKRVHKFFAKKNTRPFQESSNELRFDNEGLDNYVDDLPLTLSRENKPGVRFYSTENSELARRANRSDAEGIDSFGEPDTFSFDEADDFQTELDRKQNSNLSERYYTGGLDRHDLNR